MPEIKKPGKTRRKRTGEPPVVVLAMHGAPPLDFPKDELTEFFTLHARSGHDATAGDSRAQRRCAELEDKMRRWPRTGRNDPFRAGSVELAAELGSAAGLEVILGFNEFCSPSLSEALDQAAARARRVLVLTPMMTRGGEHSALDIPEAVRAARGRHPGIEFVYLWPFPTSDIARFLAGQIARRR